jgi:hypothetical protein
MAEKRQVSVRLPVDVRRWLRHESAETDTPISDLVERAVRAEMAQPGAQIVRSA